RRAGRRPISSLKRGAKCVSWGLTGRGWTGRLRGVSGREPVNSIGGHGQLMSMGRPRFDPRQPQRQFQIRVNHRIRVPEVRVIDANGEMLGVLSTHEALRRAQDQGLDLVEVNPKAEPPVCKILDFGKYKYEEKKKAGEAKRKQTVVEIKEIKLRPKTDDHDIAFKTKAARRFLEAGHKVKFTVRFRGREITHPEKAQ